MPKARAKAVASTETAAERRARLEAQIVQERADRIGLPDAPAARLSLVPATVRSEGTKERGGGRTVRRVADPLDVLRRQGCITETEWAAGDWWRERTQQAGLNPGGRQGLEPREGGGGRAPDLLRHAPQAVVARSALQRACRMLGPGDRGLLDAVCVQGCWQAPARTSGWNRELSNRYLARFRLALRRLAAAIYGENGG